MSPTSLPPTIHVIDDEAPFRRSLLFLLESVGWQAVGHESAEAFLETPPAFPAGGGCLVLDIRMPRISGLELQRRLKLTDENWTSYIKQVYGHDRNHPAHYDMVLDTGRLGYDATVEAILTALKARQPIR